MSGSRCQNGADRAPGDRDLNNDRRLRGNGEREKEAQPERLRYNSLGGWHVGHRQQHDVVLQAKAGEAIRAGGEFDMPVDQK